MTTLPGEHHDIGRIVNTPEEFKSWVRENMATLIRSGRWFDKDAYKEILKFLKKTKRVCAIIPEDDVAVMETHLNRFMRVFEEQGHTVLRNRTLFDGIQILVGDSDDIEEVTPLKATAPTPAPPPVPTTQPTAPSTEESVRQKNKMEIYSLLLERIIAKAALEGDQSLTKKTCREKLKDALGLSTLDPDLAFIQTEIARITALCIEYMEKDAGVVRVMTEQPIPVNIKDLFLLSPPTTAPAPVTVTAGKWKATTPMPPSALGPWQTAPPTAPVTLTPTASPAPAKAYKWKMTAPATPPTAPATPTWMDAKWKDTGLDRWTKRQLWSSA